jgi:hypothetical protein
MRYLLFICGDEKSWDDNSNTDLEEDPGLAEWQKEIDKVGTRPLGARLRPTADATTVRVRDGEVLLSDGPFAETAEQIGGFDLIECPSLDDAIDIASKHPAAAGITIEIRPIWD